MRSILTVVALSVVMAGAGLAQKGEVYRVGDGVTSPKLTKELKPVYSKGAKERKVQGTVEMLVVVLADGTVGDVSVTKSLDEDLDQAAISAVKQWTFLPGTKDDKPVNVQTNVEMSFKLR